MDMTKAMAIGLLVLSLCGYAFAQDKTPAKCPTISVTGPAGVISRPDLVVFVANVEDANDSLTYLWSISGGVIVAGQGTAKLEVRPNSYVAVQVTASIHITGLPSGCMNLATETAVSVCDPEIVFFGIWGSYGNVTWEEERKELDTLILRGLKEHPDQVAYVEKSFRYDIPWNVRQAHIRKIENYVYRFRRIPKKKFLIKQKSLERTARKLIWSHRKPQH